MAHIAYDRNDPEKIIVDAARLNDGFWADFKRGGKRGGDALIEIDEDWAAKHKFRPQIPDNIGRKVIAFTVEYDPLALMKEVRDLMCMFDDNAKLSKTAWKVSAIVCKQDDKDDTIQKNSDTDKTEPEARLQVEIHESEDDKAYKVSITRKEGDGMVFTQIAELIKTKFENIQKQ